MESKLTLKLNTESIKRAKNYISIHRGSSLSNLVENYFNSLTSREFKPDIKKIPPIVSGLAGIANKNRVKNVKEEYSEYLIEKYK